MPTARTLRVPKYRLNKTTGRASVALNGQTIWLGQHGTAESRQKYDRLIAEWLANGRELPVVREAEPLTILHLIHRFWKYAEAYYVHADSTPTQELEAIRHALRPLRQLYSDLPAEEFGPMCLRAVRQKMIQLGWARTTINKHVGRIRHLFGWAVGRELIPGSVHQALLAVEGLRRGRSEAREPDRVRPVPEAQIEAVRSCLSPQLRAMVDLQLLTGSRGTEICILRGRDLDTSGAIWIYRPSFHKSEHRGLSREILLGPKAQDVVRPFLKADLSAYLFDPRESEAWRRSQATHRRRPDQAPSMCKTDRTLGERYDRTAYARAIARACDKAFPLPSELARRRKPAAGRKEKSTRWETPEEWRARLGAEKWLQVVSWRKAHRWHPHQLRHNAATRLRRDFGIEAARIILGHRSAGVTEIYAERDLQKAWQIMEQVG